jgi:hypothetical protein
MAVNFVGDNSSEENDESAPTGVIVTLPKFPFSL